MFDDARSAFSWHQAAQFFYRGTAQVGNAAIALQKLLGSAGANAGDVEQSGVGLAHGAALTMEGDGKAMGFVANLLDEMKNGRMAVENTGLVLLAEDVEDFFFLGDTGHGLVDDL